MRVVNLPGAVELTARQHYMPPGRSANRSLGRGRTRVIGLDKEVGRRVARGSDGQEVQIATVAIGRMHVGDIDDLVRVQNGDDDVDFVQLPVSEPPAAE